MRFSIQDKYADMILDTPEFINGNTHTDERGKLSFINEFDMKAVKRFYIIEHPEINIIRAWQGHKNERKWFMPLEGSFDFFVVKLGNWEDSSANYEVQRFNFGTQSPGVLFMPPSYITGFQSLERNSKMIVFSDFTLEESKQDDYRFDQNLWYNWDKK